MRIIELASENLSQSLDAIVRAGHDTRLDLGWLRYRTLDDPTCPSDLLLLAQDGGRVVGFCFGALREGKGVVKLFGVIPEGRRAGVAGALLAELERRLRGRGISEVIVGALGPNFFEPGVDVTLTGAVSFLMQSGYETDRAARINMMVDLASADLDTRGAKADLARMGITVRRACGEDISAAAQFALETFSEGWRIEVAESARFAPPPLFIAIEGARLVGFAAYDVTGPGRFGPMGTHPDYRHRGIGGVLLKRCLRSLRDRGENEAVIVWVGPIPFYARTVEARITRTFWTFRKCLCPETQADEPNEAL